MNDNLHSVLNEVGDAFTKAMKEIEADQELFWTSLSKEDQLKAFCAVARRIFDGEIKQKGSYRYVLYQVFGFGPEAYAPAQDAGYLAIHNSIYGQDYEDKLLMAFCKKFGVEDAEQKINSFWDRP